MWQTTTGAVHNCLKSAKKSQLVSFASGSSCQRLLIEGFRGKRGRRRREEVNKCLGWLNEQTNEELTKSAGAAVVSVILLGACSTDQFYSGNTVEVSPFLPCSTHGRQWVMGTKSENACVPTGGGKAAELGATVGASKRYLAKSLAAALHSATRLLGERIGRAQSSAACSQRRPQHNPDHHYQHMFPLNRLPTADRQCVHSVFTVCLSDWQIWYPSCISCFSDHNTTLLTLSDILHLDTSAVQLVNFFSWFFIKQRYFITLPLKLLLCCHYLLKPN